MQNGKENLIKIISIQESSGGYVHKARVYLVDKRVLEAQLRLAYKIVETVNDLSTAKYVIIENLNASVTVIDHEWNVETYKSADLYYSYYDVVAEIKERDVVISQENFQNECKRQILESAPEGKSGGKIDIRLGVPKEKIEKTGKLKDGTIPERIRSEKLPAKYYRPEGKVRRDSGLQIIRTDLDKTVFRAISEIYWDKVISLVFWDKESVVGMMFDDFKILPLNFTLEQYKKISKLFGHVVSEESNE